MPHLHRRLIAVSFALLGLHVGVRAVQLADLALSLDLDSAQLGTAASLSAVAGIVTLAAGAWLVDRLGRRIVLLLGLAGTGLAFIATALVDDYTSFLATSLAYGLLISFLDLAANTIGSDYERATGHEEMTRFHAWFSLSATSGALLSATGLAVGQGFRPAFLTLGALMLLGGVWSVRQPFPPTSTADHPADSPAATATTLPRGVLLAALVVTLCFFGDGILETFLAVLLRAKPHTPVWVSGVTLALFHLASWSGRMFSHHAVGRFGDRVVLGVAGVVAAMAMCTSLWLTQGWWTTAGFALVGFALSPIVPLGMSLAGRYASRGAAGRAIGLTNAVGYSAFIAGPAAAGVIADHYTLSIGVTTAAITMLGVSLVSLTLPPHK